MLMALFGGNDMQKYLFLGGLVSYFVGGSLAFGVTTEVAKPDVRPIETICAGGASYVSNTDSILNGHFAVVGTVSDDRCWGGGLNAYRVKSVESGDVICTSRSVLYAGSEGLKNANFLKAYTVTPTYSENCPPSYDTSKNVRLASNAARLDLISHSSPYVWKAAGGIYDLIANGFVRTSITNTDSTYTWDWSSISVLDASVETGICAYWDPPTGYAEKGDYYYTASCSDTYGNRRLYVTTDWFVPGDTASRITAPSRLVNYIVARSYISEPMVLAVYPTRIDHTSRKLVDVHRPTSVLEFHCFNDVGSLAAASPLPIGYRPDAVYKSAACLGSEFAWNNASDLKLITAEVESFCNATEIYSSSSVDKQIPRNYVKTGESSDSRCGQSAQRIHIRKLHDTDIVCKGTAFSSDYGRVGQVNSAGCSGTGMNAWMIRKLEVEDAVCQSEFKNSSRYVAVGQVSIPACPGVGNNAWLIRAPKTPTDVICSAQQPYLEGYTVTPLAVTQAPQCPAYIAYQITLNL